MPMKLSTPRITFGTGDKRSLKRLTQNEVCLRSDSPDQTITGRNIMSNIAFTKQRPILYQRPFLLQVLRPMGLPNVYSNGRENMTKTASNG